MLDDVDTDTGHACKIQICNLEISTFMYVTSKMNEKLHHQKGEHYKTFKVTFSFCYFT